MNGWRYPLHLWCLLLRDKSHLFITQMAVSIASSPCLDTGTSRALRQCWLGGLALEGHSEAKPFCFGIGENSEAKPFCFGIGENRETKPFCFGIGENSEVKPFCFGTLGLAS